MVVVSRQLSNWPSLHKCSEILQDQDGSLLHRVFLNRLSSRHYQCSKQFCTSNVVRRSPSPGPNKSVTTVSQHHLFSSTSRSHSYVQSNEHSPVLLCLWIFRSLFPYGFRRGFYGPQTTSITVQYLRDIASTMSTYVNIRQHPSLTRWISCHYSVCASIHVSWSQRSSTVVQFCNSMASRCCWSSDVVLSSMV